MVVPGLLLVGQVSASLAATILDIIKICIGSDDVREARYQHSAAAMSWMSFSVNIITTGMIVGRLWWADRRLKSAFSNSNNTVPQTGYNRIIISIIESGAIYTVFTLVYLVSNYVGDVSSASVVGCPKLMPFRS